MISLPVPPPSPILAFTEVTSRCAASVPALALIAGLEAVAAGGGSLPHHGSSSSLASSTASVQSAVTEKGSATNVDWNNRDKCESICSNAAAR